MSIKVSGGGIGMVLAVIISWGLNHSVIWAIIHGLCGWFYVLYWALCLR